ncbi:MAG TPA: hypothetical protein VIR29_04425 [Anseongella sp.]
MPTFTLKADWGPRSISWWLVLILATGIIYIGLRFMISPDAEGEGFGIPFQNAEDAVY